MIIVSNKVTQYQSLSYNHDLYAKPVHYPSLLKGVVVVKEQVVVSLVLLDQG